jgi:hypothetical protein
MAFADELISLRTAAGFRTVAEFSHQISELGYPVSYFELRRYEKGEYLPTLPAFAAIVDALGLTQRELMRLVRSVPPTRFRRTTSEPGTSQPPAAPVPGSL